VALYPLSYTGKDKNKNKDTENGSVHHASTRYAAGPASSYQNHELMSVRNERTPRNALMLMATTSVTLP
jgi:hypothetical protein